MAGIQLTLKGGGLKASSILEVIIAMVVIVVVFSIAMGIFANVQRLSLSEKKIHAHAVLKELLLKVEHAPDLDKQTFTADNLRIEQQITVYNNTANLHQIVLAAYDDNGEKIAELKEVVYDGR